MERESYLYWFDSLNQYFLRKVLIIMQKYLLSTGIATDKIEDYIVDLFRLYLQIWPGEIPGLPQLGFDFILTDIKKADLVNNVTSRLSCLINIIQDKFGAAVTILLNSVEIINETRVQVTITVNDTTTDKFIIEL